MFIEPKSPKNLEAPSERNNALCSQADSAPLELKTLSGALSYKHLAALRPGHDLG